MNLDEYHREGREAVWRRNRRELRADADEQADRLRDRFKAVSRRIDRTLRRQKRTIWIWACLGILCGGYIGLTMASPWSIGLTIRHLLAARNCATARLVDLAPAARGEPGYWARNDADDDGIACEPWPPRWRSSRWHP